MKINIILCNRIHLLSALISVLSLPVWSVNILTEDFETDGNGVRYTTTNEFNPIGGDHWRRINDPGAPGPSTSPAIDLDGPVDYYSGYNGEWYYSGEDLNSSGPDFRTMDFNISTSGFTDIEFSGLFAAGDTDSSPSYDSDHFLAVLTSSDSGANFTPGLVFRPGVSSSDWTNFLPAQVLTITPSGANGINTMTDLGNQLASGSIVSATGTTSVFSYMSADGGTTASAGTALGQTFQEFTFEVPDGTDRVRIVVQASDGNVEFAFDNIRIDGTAIPEPSTFIMCSLAFLLCFFRMFRQIRK